MHFQELIKFVIRNSLNAIYIHHSWQLGTISRTFVVFKMMFPLKLLRAYVACKYCFPWSFLAGFLMSTFIVSIFYFSIAKQTDKNITFLFMTDFWCLVDSYVISMHLLLSRWHFLSVQYLNVFLQPAFRQLIIDIFCHCWTTNELLLDEKWLFWFGTQGC